MKSKRVFLESLRESDSYIRVAVDEDSGDVNIKLSDCDRRIWWYFGRPGDRRAKKKIAVVKRIVDEVYEHLHAK